jgi:KUP system potassium uptake protein
VAEGDRMKIEKLSERFTKIELLFGFMQDQNVSEAPACPQGGL